MTSRRDRLFPQQKKQARLASLLMACFIISFIPFSVFHTHPPTEIFHCGSESVEFLDLLNDHQKIPSSCDDHDTHIDIESENCELCDFIFKKNLFSTISGRSPKYLYIESAQEGFNKSNFHQSTLHTTHNRGSPFVC